MNRGFFGGMDEDPFFAAHRNHMNNMNQMFGGAFGNMPMGPRMIEDQRNQRPDERSKAVRPMVDPFGFGMFDSMFSNMRNMMTTMPIMHQQIGQHGQVGNDPNSHMYTQSSFMSYSNTGNGAPKVYQSSSSTRRAPGGVKETKKMERDSESGLDRMAVGHHINDRGHVIERSRNRRTGDQDENQEFINLDDNQAQEFDREWTDKTKQFKQGPSSLEYARRGQRSDRRRDNLAIEGGRRKDRHEYRERD